MVKSAASAGNSADSAENAIPIDNTAYRAAMFDTIIIGGGPAGQSAALVLARCRRRIIVVDAAEPRNRRAVAMHGYLTRDGINPLEFLRLGRAEIHRYGVPRLRDRVAAARRLGAGFEIRCQSGTRLQARKLLLATGVVDELPSLAGLDSLYGVSVHHCPYCDGWEWRDRRLAAFGRGPDGAHLALTLLQWSADVVVVSDRKTTLSARQHRLLSGRGIRVAARPVARLEGARGMLRRIVFDDGTSEPRDALFFNTGQRQASQLARKLGCEVDRHHGIKADRRQCTSEAGVFVAGDAERDVQFVIIAAAEGATAAVAINAELHREDAMASQRR